MRRPVPAILLAVGLAATGCGSGDEAATQEPTLVAPVEAVSVGVHRFTETVDGWGAIAPLPEGLHVVTPLYGGRVARLSTEVGARVRAGDPLCDVALDPAAVAEIGRLRRVLALAERNRDRQRRAFELGVVSRVVVEQAELDAANAHADLAARTHDYDPARQQLTLRAPAAGIVTAVDVRPGQQIDPTTKAAIVVDPGALAATVRVDAPASFRVVVGQAATVVPVEARRPGIRAHVVRTAPVLDPASQRADVWLAYEDGDFAPGTYVRAAIAVGARDSPAVPRAALVKSDHGYRVFVLADGAAHARDVTLGVVDGDLAEVRDGLSPEEQVAGEGAQELADGMRVSVRGGSGGS